MVEMRRDQLKKVRGCRQLENAHLGLVTGCCSLSSSSLEEVEVMEERRRDDNLFRSGRRRLLDVTRRRNTRV